MRLALRSTRALLLLVLVLLLLLLLAVLCAAVVADFEAESLRARVLLACLLACHIQNKAWQSRC
jgi:hypothetical protein